MRFVIYLVRNSIITGFPICYSQCPHGQNTKASLNQIKLYASNSISTSNLWHISPVRPPTHLFISLYAVAAARWMDGDVIHCRSVTFSQSVHTAAMLFDMHSSVRVKLFLWLLFLLLPSKHATLGSIYLNLCMCHILPMHVNIPH